MKSEKKEHEGGKREGGAGKKHLASMTHHFLPDGTVVHEHVYKDKPESHTTHPPRMMGTSASLEDAQQHLADHYPQQDQPEPGQQQAGEDAEEQPDAQPDVQAQGENE
jgi:hypothetical protein